MSQKNYKREHWLTIQQQNAIDLLVTGKTDQAVADAVGVARPSCSEDPDVKGTETPN